MLTFLSCYSHLQGKIILTSDFFLTFKHSNTLYSDWYTCMKAIIKRFVHKYMCSFSKTETVNLQQIYFRENYLHHQCYEYTKLAPIAATGVSLCKLVVPPITVHGMGLQLPDGDGLLDPLDDPGFLFHGKLAPTPIDGVIGLYHMVHVRESFFLALVNLTSCSKVMSLLHAFSCASYHCPVSPM